MNEKLSAAPRVDAPTSEGGFRPDVQGLRAVAVSMVVIYQVRLTPCDGAADRVIPRDPPTVRAARLDGTVKLINMNSFICGPSVCPSVIGNVLVYFDAHHQAPEMIMLAVMFNTL